MSAFVFNCAKGRVGGYYSRVQGNDPSTSALVVVVLKDTGLEADATLKDYDTLSALTASTNDEVTNTNYARKTLTDSDLSAISPDDSLDQVILSASTQTWSSVASGDTWAKVLICYDPVTGSGTDADLIPLTAHSVTVVPDGSDVSISLASFFKAVDGS